jgi:methionine synthase II (cobalamin-independent)
VKRSTQHILTTHVGALPAPTGLSDSAQDYEDRLAREVAAIVRRQRDIGLDIVNDGELSKGHWLAYLDKRLGGFEQRPAQGARSALHSGKDREAFPVSHATNIVEHPELVSERIRRFPRLLGKENVIAGTDGGLGGRLHPEIVWAKLQSLVEGARLATKALQRH